ncbi:hypothetical protein CYMTET_20295, partial [Cymbomonas tetramitiformis]
MLRKWCVTDSLAPAQELNIFGGALKRSFAGKHKLKANISWNSPACKVSWTTVRTCKAVSSWPSIQSQTAEYPAVRSSSNLALLQPSSRVQYASSRYGARRPSRCGHFQRGFTVCSSTLKEHESVLNGSGTFDSLEGYGAVVKILATEQAPDWINPWQTRTARRRSGSGVLICRKGEPMPFSNDIANAHVILTAAHVVANQTFLQ